MSDKQLNDVPQEWHAEDLVEALNQKRSPDLERAVRQTHKLGMEFAPQLIEIIEAATERAAFGNILSSAHIIALFLLTEYRAKQALPAIIRSFSVSSEQLDALWGDVTTELLPGILAALADDQIDLIDSLIADKNLDEYVRWNAASTYVLLVRDGVISRADAIARLRSHLDRTIADLDRGNSAGIVLALESLVATETLDAIKEVIRLELLPPMLTSFQSIEESTAHGDKYLHETFKNCRPTGMPDAVEEMRKWHLFDEFDRSAKLESRRIKYGQYSSLPPWRQWKLENGGATDESDSPATIHNSKSHVGRNSPCPCGSGKKFKKCCGGRHTN